jgi:hypothetical protein
MAAGNKATALHEPFRVVISENEAIRIFGSTSLTRSWGVRLFMKIHFG